MNNLHISEKSLDKLRILDIGFGSTLTLGVLACVGTLANIWTNSELNPKDFAVNLGACSTLAIITHLIDKKSNKLRKNIVATQQTDGADCA